MKRAFLLVALMVTIQSVAVATYTSVKDTSFYRSTASLVKFSPEDVQYGDATIFETNRFIAYKRAVREVTRHQITYIKTQEGLDDNNKIVIYVPPRGEISEIRARSITASGVVLELNKDNIKEMKDYEGGADLKMFAIEGAEVGGQVEYSYTVQSPLYDSGKELFSMDYKTQHACFIIRCFSEFAFGSKSFNWENKRTKKDYEHKYIYKDIMPIGAELYATPRANRVAVEYKLLGSGYSESPFANFHNVLKKFKGDFFAFSSKELSKVKAVTKGFEGTTDDKETTLRNLSVYLKKRYSFTNDYQKEEYSNLYSIIKSGIGTDVGLIRLYCLVLTKMDYDYEVHVSGNKYNVRLDNQYCSRSALTEYVLYFPAYDTYLYPPSPLAHYGLAPPWVLGSEALIVAKSSSYPKFIEISSRPAGENRTDLKINVAMDLSNNTSLFDIEAFGTGQLARTYNTGAFYAETEDETKKIAESYVTWRYPKEQILSVEMVDREKWGDIATCEDFACKREFTAKVKSSSFYEKAGENLLLQVGALIGPQTELYAELERIQPITTANNKCYSFEIRIAIPDGYKYEGAQNVEIDNEFDDGAGNKYAGFKSTVKVEGTEVVIEIYEYYDVVNIDKKYYEDYRRVINSAADYNKGVVLLKRE
jgi:hypothetical protein